jgi:hypothetical protein
MYYFSVFLSLLRPTLLKGLNKFYLTKYLHEKQVAYLIYLFVAYLTMLSVSQAT